jgi:hypothetical protein
MEAIYEKLGINARITGSDISHHSNGVQIKYHDGSITGPVGFMIKAELDGIVVALQVQNEANPRLERFREMIGRKDMGKK